MTRTRRRLIFPVTLSLAVCIWLLGGLGEFPAIGQEESPAPKVQGYAGSVSCRECHEKFYQLWSTSFHGLAMQPYSAVFAKEKLTPHQGDITIGKEKYRADINEGMMIETGRKGPKKYTIEHVLGGKNVYYFLTPFSKGRLKGQGEEEVRKRTPQDGGRPPKQVFGGRSSYGFPWRPTF